MDREFLTDLFQPFGPVTIRRMFSGFGISADGVNFALVIQGAIYLRADAETIAQFQAEGTAPFEYTTRLRTVTVGSYWRLPDRLLDDPDELAQWARRALAAAERAALTKARKPNSKPPAAKASAVKAGAVKAGAAKAGTAKVGAAKPKRARPRPK